MVAYLDRPEAREKDLGDLAHIMCGYVCDHSDRRFSLEVRTHVRLLVRNARKELELGKPPKSARLLYRSVRRLSDPGN